MSAETGLIPISSDFRPNIARSVSIFGDIGDELVSRLAKEILQLRSAGDDTITVLINSNGGMITCADYIWDLMRSPDMDGCRPRLITVAVGNARSAAANMLALGDYAICYPNAEIHFHGVRYGEVADVTVESASSIAAQLTNRNRITASRLSRAGSERLAFHYARLKDRFADVRKESNDQSLSSVECFARLLKSELSSNGDRIVDNAIERWKSLRTLYSEAVDQIRAAHQQGVDFEAKVLKSVIDWEVQKNKGTEWSVVGGIYQIVADFLLLHEYDTGRHLSLVKTIFDRFGDAFIETPQDEAAYAAVSDPKTASEQIEAAGRLLHQNLKTFCYFAASICQGLQENENPLTPVDAYWLGVIDEIYGSNLPCLRMIAEQASRVGGDSDTEKTDESQ